jgi:hypothetical protein
MRGIPVFPKIHTEIYEERRSETITVTVSCLARVKHTDGKYWLTLCERSKRIGKIEAMEIGNGKMTPSIEVIEKMRGEVTDIVIMDAYILSRFGKADTMFRYTPVTGASPEYLFQLDPDQRSERKRCGQCKDDDCPDEIEIKKSRFNMSFIYKLFTK